MNLKLARMQKGLNQRELAKIIGVHPALVSQYEHKKRRPSIETAKKIADTLGFDWSLIDEEEEDDRPEQEKQEV